MVKLVNSKIYNSIIPDYTSLYSYPLFDEFKAEINQLLKQYLEKMEAVSLREGLTAAMHIAAAGNNFLQSNRFDNKLATNEPEKAAAVAGIAVNLIHLCASIFEPYLPATSRSILEQLQVPFLIIPDQWTADHIKPGHEIGKAKYLFSLIDPKKEDEWREMFGGTQAERAKRDEEAAKKMAKKADAAAKKAAKRAASKKQGSDEEEPAASKRSIESTATSGAKAMDAGKEPVDAVTDGVQQVTLPTS